MATPSLIFVPRSVKVGRSKVAATTASGLASSGELHTAANISSYPRDVLLRVVLQSALQFDHPGELNCTLQIQTRRKLERLVSHSVDYVVIKQSSSDLAEPGGTRIAHRNTQWTCIVRTPDIVCARELLEALLRRGYCVERLSVDEQELYWDTVPLAAKNRCRGRAERRMYALRKMRARAMQHPSPKIAAPLSM